MRDVTVEDIYIGNGVSELIVQAMQALLNSGDEMPVSYTHLWRRLNELVETLPARLKQVQLNPVDSMGITKLLLNALSLIHI